MKKEKLKYDCVRTKAMVIVVVSKGKEKVYE